VISDDESDISFSRRRTTRASEKIKKKTADFGPLIATRSKAVNKKSTKNPVDNKDYFDDLAERIRRDNSEKDKSNEAPSDAKLSTRSHDSGSTGKSSYCSLSIKEDKKKDYRIRTSDYAAKNPTQKSRRKTLPIHVTKDDAEKELQYTREDWLRMDPAALGERCLEHLSELEQQRARCSNISGRVAGRMKESKQIATEITKAMIEKLTTVGDIFTLKNENYALKEELNELKRREQAQGREIESLRKLVATLEREVRSLKEGIGPFPAVKKVSKKPSPLSKRTEERKNSSSLSLQQDMRHNEMDAEPPSTPGCSADQDYMNRDNNCGTDWPRGRDTVSWNSKTNDIDTNKDTNIANIKSKIRTTNIYTSSKSKITTSTNVNINERNSIVKTIEPVRL